MDIGRGHYDAVTLSIVESPDAALPPIPKRLPNRRGAYPGVFRDGERALGGRGCFPPLTSAGSAARMTGPTRHIRTRRKHHLNATTGRRTPVPVPGSRNRQGTCRNSPPRIWSYWIITEFRGPNWSRHRRGASPMRTKFKWLRCRGRITRTGRSARSQP